MCARTSGRIRVCELFYAKHHQDKPGVQSVRGYPVLPGNSSHGNTSKHDLALLSESTGWDEISWAPYKWIQILNLFNMVSGQKKKQNID